MILNKITSQSNTSIKEAFAIKKKRSKYNHNSFLIEGPHLVEMAIASGIQINKVFLTKSFSTRTETQKLLRKISKKNREIFKVTELLLNKLADTENPQGIVAVVTYKPSLIDELSLINKPLIVLIDGVQDPGNLGTILRISDAAGADAVIILPGTCNAFMPKTIRATAGSIFNIPIIYAEQAPLLKWLRDRNIQLAITSPDQEESLFDVNLTKPTAFVFGNEAHGVSEQIRKAGDLFLSIPIYGKAESLNVATAAGVCLYEAARQRRTNHLD
jgi:TrmH family RNA methyltransferase